jgi:hypothetical protein
MNPGDGFLKPCASICASNRGVDRVVVSRRGRGRRHRREGTNRVTRAFVTKSPPARFVRTHRVHFMLLHLGTISLDVRERGFRALPRRVAPVRLRTAILTRARARRFLFASVRRAERFVHRGHGVDLREKCITDRRRRPASPSVARVVVEHRVASSPARVAFASFQRHRHRRRQRARRSTHRFLASNLAP